MLTKHIVASLAIAAVTALGYLVDAPKTPNDFTYVGPNIADSNGYTQVQIDQIHAASNDAVYFSKLVLDSAGNATLANATFDRVLKRYFDPKDRDFVLGVFKAIVNTHKDPINNPSDAVLALRNIHVVPDWINDRYPVHACPPGGTQNYAALREWTDPIPQLVLCSRLFKHGAFPRPNAPKWIAATQPTCSSVGERVTRKMFTMGTVFVRAFTYWKYIMGPAFGGRGQGYAQELATGPVKAAQFGHENATLNGDSYAWFATELAWTLLCNKQFGAPLEGDDADL